MSDKFWNFKRDVEFEEGTQQFFNSAAEHLAMTSLRTLEDMTEEEILELERIYGCPVQRPKEKK